MSLPGEEVESFADVGDSDAVALFLGRAREVDYMVHDVGFGIRYKTPVGPVRVDLAYSINPPSFVAFSGTPAQILNCNPTVPLNQLPLYCSPSPQSISHFQFFFSIGQTF